MIGDLPSLIMSLNAENLEDSLERKLNQRENEGEEGNYWKVIQGVSPCDWKHLDLPQGLLEGRVIFGVEDFVEVDDERKGEIGEETRGLQKHHEVGVLSDFHSNHVADVEFEGEEIRASHDVHQKSQEDEVAQKVSHFLNVGQQILQVLFLDEGEVFQRENGDGKQTKDECQEKVF